MQSIPIKRKFSCYENVADFGVNLQSPTSSNFMLFMENFSYVDVYIFDAFRAFQHTNTCRVCVDLVGYIGKDEIELDNHVTVCMRACV